VFAAGEHVPDRFGEAAGEVDLGDLGAALLADARLRLLVALAVGGVGAGVGGGLDERPAQVAGSLLGRRPTLPGAHSHARGKLRMSLRTLRDA
jgi:hypothetical protein